MMQFVSQIMQKGMKSGYELRKGGYEVRKILLSSRGRILSSRRGAMRD